MPGDAGRLAPAVVGSASVLLLLGAWELVGNMPDSAIATVMPPPSLFLASVAESGFRIGLGAQAVTVYQAVFSTLFRVFAGMGIGPLPGSSGTHMSLGNLVLPP